MLTNYEIMIIELSGKLSLDEAKNIINPHNDDNVDDILKSFKVKKKPTTVKEEKRVE